MFNEFDAQRASHIAKGVCIEESSHQADHYKCEYALDGVSHNGQGNEWASNGEGVGAYMKIKFNKRYTINRIKLMQRIGHCELNKEINLCFDDGSCQLVSMSLYLSASAWRGKQKIQSREQGAEELI